MLLMFIVIAALFAMKIHPLLPLLPMCAISPLLFHTMYGGDLLILHSVKMLE